jgi:hypothetical protein
MRNIQTWVTGAFSQAFSLREGRGAGQTDEGTDEDESRELHVVFCFVVLLDIKRLCFLEVEICLMEMRTAGMKSKFISLILLSSPHPRFSLLPSWTAAVSHHTYPSHQTVGISE